MRQRPSLRYGMLLPVLALAACAAPPRPATLDRLRPCTDREAPTDAYCGTLRVFENRDTAQGRTIDLSIVVLPALGRENAPDPLFFLAGGPGQGAAKLARHVRQLFPDVQSERDIVLVDQRGTGHSHPLECPDDQSSLASLSESDEATLARLRGCLAAFDADVRFYTTPMAMDDLDQVREYLGYDHINLYGGSYGTRAALVYLRQHPSRVRAVVLDGVAPPDMRLPLYLARDLQRALDLLLASCEADEPCRSRYPNLSNRLHALVQRLSVAPAHVSLVHPRTGIAEDVTIDGRAVATLLSGALYAPLVASLLPEFIVRAEAGDFQGLVALGSMNEAGSENMSVGMHLSVVCSEDAPRIRDGDVARASAGTIFSDYLAASRLKACDFWPRGSLPADFYDPVVSQVPALVLSGALDPVTPPSWGTDVAVHLSHGRHFVAPAAGHGVVNLGCGARLVAEFIARGRADELDAQCLDTPTRPPFFLGPTGPDPARAPAHTGGTR